MAVDAPAVRKDIFNLLQMFGPQNAGGPPQVNTNPGSNPKPQPDLDAIPPPKDPETTGAIPQPTGVRPLPPATPIVDNSAQATAAAAPTDAIELLPGDADPNILPPALRDNPIFRYMQAQRAAQYKVAEEQAKWQNFTGGLGNIAQIVAGGQPTNQTGVRADGSIAPLGFNELRALQGDISAAQKAAQEAAAAAEQKANVDKLLPTVAEQMNIPLEQLKLMRFTNEKDVADFIKNRSSYSDSEKERVRINTERKAAGRPEIGPEAWHRQGIGEDILKAEATSAGGVKANIAGKDIETAKTSNAAMEQTLIRNAAARSAIESGAGITGGGWTGLEFEQKANEIAAHLGINAGAVSNDQVVIALMAKNAIDMSQDMKGALSDKDIQMLNAAAAGKIELSADVKSRIIALNDLQARRKIDQNNASLTRAGERLGEDRTKEHSKPNPMTTAELREINPAIAREIIRDSKRGYELAKFQYGESVAKELVDRADEVITAHLYEPRARDSKINAPGSQARTQLNKDADSYYRTAPIERLEANREAIIANLNTMDPSKNGAATYELILEARRAGRYGAKP